MLSGPHSAAPPPLAWQAGRPGSAKPGRYFFQKRHLAPWQAHKQLCWQPGLAGVCRVFRLLPLRTLSRRRGVLSAGPALPPPPSRGRGRGWGGLRAAEGSPPASPCGRTLETHLGTVSCQLAFRRWVNLSESSVSSVGKYESSPSPSTFLLSDLAWI